MGIFKDSLKFKITKGQTHPTNSTGNINQPKEEYKIDELTIKKQQNDDQKKQLLSNPIDKNIKGIKNHRKIAGYLQVAAKNHLEAAIYHQDGNHEKAAQSTIVAQANFNLADKAQRKDMNQHAING